MIKKAYLILIAAGFFALVFKSCEKDPLESRKDKEEIIINNDLSSLGRRVEMALPDHVMPIYSIPALKGDHKTESMKQKDVSSNYILKLRAEVSPPSHEGKTLQASHIKIVGNYAYVTYNTKGDEYLGGVDIFDITDISNPELISNAIFTDKDVSSIDVIPQGAGKEHFVYVIGAENIDVNTELSSPALIERYLLNEANQFKHLDEPRQITDLESYAGTDVKFFDNNIFATSGSAGGLTVLTTGMGKESYMEYSYARSVDADDEKLVMFSGMGGGLYVWDKSADYLAEGYAPVHIETGGANIPVSKSMVRISDDFAFVALGDEGMKMFDIAGGEMIDYIPRPAFPDNGDYDENDYVTNGVSVNVSEYMDNADIILVANGGAGVYVSQLTEDNEIALIGSMKFEEGSSANFVEAQDNKVFVATGKGGLKILEIVHYDPGDGNYPVDPVDPEPTIPCETLYDKLISMFPERQSIHEGEHADLIGDELPGSVRLTEKAPVYISFVHNGAGWDNSFGYYHYDAENPPASVDDLQLNILLPDAKYHEGNKLKQGDRFRLGGPTVEFNANTVIGFFIVAKGWDRGQGKMVKGIHTVYTDQKFNHEGMQRHVLFLEEECMDIVLSFEDMISSSSDEDFNDMMFVVSNGDDEFGVQTNYAIDTTGLPVK